MSAVRVATLNVASGRDRHGRHLDAEALAGALGALDVDVLALQELDVDQPRSLGVHQGRVAADALGAAHWRFAPTLVGTPGETWEQVVPHVRGADDSGPHGPCYGVGLVSRLPVSTWSVLGLGRGRGRLPLRVGADGLAVPSQVTGDRGDRPTLAAQRVHVDVVLPCEHERQGLP